MWLVTRYIRFVLYQVTSYLCPSFCELWVMLSCTLQTLANTSAMRSVVSIYNAVGEGPTSTPQEVFVGEAGEDCLAFCGHVHHCPIELTTNTRPSTLCPLLIHCVRE